MTFIFTPGGVPVSSSFAISASMAETASTVIRLNTASIAAYVIDSVGPVGPPGISVFATVP